MKFMKRVGRSTNCCMSSKIMPSKSMKVSFENSARSVSTTFRSASNRNRPSFVENLRSISLHTDARVDIQATPDRLAIIAAEKRGKMKAVLLGAIALILIGQLLLGLAPHTILSVAAILFVYFLGFNVLEASQPSLVPGTRKGAAAGVYNTTQSIGLAMGGVIGGWLLKVDGQSAVFFACSGLVFC